MTKTLTLELSEAEMKAVEDLAEFSDMSHAAVMRQALRLYQLVTERAKAGETMSFSGDQERAKKFFDIENYLDNL